MIKTGNVLLPYNNEGEPINVKCRYRSLGCMPCTGAVESNVVDLDGIIDELNDTVKSEREFRLIDQTSSDSLENKKKNGYF